MVRLHYGSEDEDSWRKSVEYNYAKSYKNAGEGTEKDESPGVDLNVINSTAW